MARSAFHVGRGNGSMSTTTKLPFDLSLVLNRKVFLLHSSPTSPWPSFLPPIHHPPPHHILRHAHQILRIDPAQRLVNPDLPFAFFCRFGHLEKRKSILPCPHVHVLYHHLFRSVKCVLVLFYRDTVCQVRQMDRSEVGGGGELRVKKRFSKKRTGGGD